MRAVFSGKLFSKAFNSTSTRRFVNKSRRTTQLRSRWCSTAAAEREQVPAGSSRAAGFSSPLSSSTSKAFADIPGPPAGVPAYLEFQAFGGEEWRSYAHIEFKKKYGNLVRVEMPGFSSVITYDLDDTRTVFSMEGKYPFGAAQIVTRPMQEIMDELGLGSSIASISGHEWKVQRTFLQKDITPPPVAHSYLPLIESSVRNLVDHFPELVKLDDGFVISSLDMLHAILFGTPFVDYEKAWPENEWYNWVQVGRKFVPLLVKLRLSPPETHEQHKQELREVFTYLAAVVQKQGQKTVDNFASFADLKSPPYLYRLHTRGEEGIKHANSFTTAGLLLAGLDTTASAISWIIYNLARTPAVQEKLYQEVSSLLKGGPLQEEHLRSIPYLRACMKESYRVTPLITSHMRILENDVTLQGYTVPAGIPIEMSSIPTLLDEDVFPNASVYIPDRWLDTDKHPIRNHPYLVLPFGIGSRMCLGSRVAETEIMAVISALVQKYQFTTNSVVRICGSQGVNTPSPKPTFEFKLRQ